MLLRSLRQTAHNVEEAARFINGTRRKRTATRRVALPRQNRRRPLRRRAVPQHQSSIEHDDEGSNLEIVVAAQAEEDADSMGSDSVHDVIQIPQQDPGSSFHPPPGGSTPSSSSIAFAQSQASPSAASFNSSIAEVREREERETAPPPESEPGIPEHPGPQEGPSGSTGQPPLPTSSGEVVLKWVRPTPGSMLVSCMSLLDCDR